jgi:hypothetical protein
MEAKSKAATFSFFGGGGGGGASTVKASAPTNMPSLSRWRQNADGSITGIISNSKSFQKGTKITTSPVKKGATPGSIVKTGSGSQYYLK